MPVAFGINYISNDEWVHYNVVSRFLNGDFTLHHYIGSTFYLMGFMAAAFAKLFGLAKLPILTLTVSLVSVLVLNIILYKLIKTALLDSVLLSLFLLGNPIFVYCMWGFMIDNFLLMFIILSFYWYLQVTEQFALLTRNRLYLYLTLGNVAAILGYAVKQLSAITILAVAVYFFGRAISSPASSRKQYIVPMFYQAGVFVLLMLYHFFLFPKTNAMWETKLAYGNIFYARYMFSLFFIVGIYVCSFLPPLALIGLRLFKNAKGWHLVALYGVLLGLCLWYFKPTIRWNENYFYLQNVLGRKGFFVDNLHGAKFSFVFSLPAYLLADVGAKMLTVLMGVYVLLKKRFDFLLTYIVVYTLALSVSLATFDRYLLPILAASIIFMAKELKVIITPATRITLALILLVMFFYAYNYSADYIITNRYVWTKTTELVQNQHIPGGNIVATSAWKYITEGTKTKNMYKFTYDGPQTEEYKNTAKYSLIETKQISYPLSFWTKPYLYLYKVSE